MIRRLTASTAILASLYTGTALAADLPASAPPPVPFVPAFSWTGIYLGANIGFGGDRFVYPLSVAVPAVGGAASGSASITSSGVLGGGQIGFNWQFQNNFVAGLEADFDGAAIRGKVAANIGGAIIVPFGAAAQAGSRINYIGTVRGRLGYAWDRFMIYGTGGFAYGEVNSSLSAAAGIAGAAATFTTSQNSGRTGWAAGGGFEYAILNNLTVKTEYLYVDLGTNVIFNSTVLGAAGITLSQRTTANIVRAGLNYKFNWFVPPPIAAKY
ncbi:MAG: outer membrane beta-barrel protein [Beijerinckiaceae bacterium]|nr:outer membrane beta-barrel protein [Beijerinckiaceae bacterium]